MHFRLLLAKGEGWTGSPLRSKDRGTDAQTAQATAGGTAARKQTLQRGSINELAYTESGMAPDCCGIGVIDMAPLHGSPEQRAQGRLAHNPGVRTG